MKPYYVYNMNKIARKDAIHDLKDYIKNDNSYPEINNNINTGLPCSSAADVIRGQPNNCPPSPPNKYGPDALSVVKEEENNFFDVIKYNDEPTIPNFKSDYILNGEIVRGFLQKQILSASQEYKVYLLVNAKKSDLHELFHDSITFRIFPIQRKISIIQDLYCLLLLFTFLLKTSELCIGFSTP